VAKNLFVVSSYNNQAKPFSSKQRLIVSKVGSLRFCVAT